MDTGTAQHASGAWREHGAFAHLLGDDVAVGAHGGERALGDVERGLGGVDLDLGAHAAMLKLDRTIEVGLGLVALRLVRLDARIEALHLKDELGIGDDSDLGAGGGAVALLDAERSNRPADARPCEQLMNRPTVAITAFRSATSLVWTANSPPASAGGDARSKAAIMRFARTENSHL